MDLNRVVESRRSVVEARIAARSACHWCGAWGVICGLLLAALAVSLSSCSTIDPQNRVEGWPNLEIVERKVSFGEVQDKCRPFVGWGQWPMACATFYFREAQCRIYYAFDWALPHERQHCKGFDHPGSNDMRAMYRDWKARD